MVIPVLVIQQALVKAPPSAAVQVAEMLLTELELSFVEVRFALALQQEQEQALELLAAALQEGPLFRQVPLSLLQRVFHSRLFLRNFSRGLLDEAGLFERKFRVNKECLTEILLSLIEITKFIQ